MEQEPGDSCVEKRRLFCAEPAYDPEKHPVQARMRNIIGGRREESRGQKGNTILNCVFVDGGPEWTLGK